jgi:CelD/BcsL family acetyltransferase involved in cellulose biosynthesis
LTQIEIREAAEIDTEMPKFMSLHKINWQRQGKLGYFSAWPKSDVFNHRLAVRLAGLGRTLLIRVSAGEIPIIYQYGYVFGDGFYWELPARASGDEWDRFSLGATAIMILIRRSIESGIRRIEAGLSHYEYKTRLGARDLGVYVLRFVGRAPGSQAKYFLCRMLHRFLQMVYYRLWYTRIQPRLPQAFCRPIWMIYIRMIL